MALFPTLMNDSIFSDLFDDPFFNGLHGLHHVATDSGTTVTNLMNTDVRETNGGYDVDIDLPGFTKDDIKVELNNGYLTVSAQRDQNKDEQDKNGKWLRRERYAGTCSRSFYVGDDVKESDIHAKYQDGTIRLQLPKTNPQQVEKKHTISIES